MSLLDWIFPRKCLACRNLSESLFCDGCSRQVKGIAVACPVCGTPLPETEHRCAPCLQDPPSFDRTVAWGSYEGVLRELIGRLKYRGEETIAGRLGGLLAEKVAERDLEVDGLVPVPLHTRRLRQRGFNQAVLLGRVLSKRLGIPLDPFCLTKRLDTQPQTALDRDERGRNLRNAFEVTRPGRVEGRHVMLVDDVMTTGATAEACARRLKQAGAVAVTVAVVARTP